MVDKQQRRRQPLSSLKLVSAAESQKWWSKILEDLRGCSYIVVIKRSGWQAVRQLGRDVSSAVHLVLHHRLSDAKYTCICNIGLL